MQEMPKVEKWLENEYDWSEEELLMPLVYQGQYIDFLPEDGSQRSVKSAARWDGHSKRVIVRAVGGFRYVINDVKSMPNPEEAHRIYSDMTDLWREWYLEQLDNPENIPDSTTVLH